MKSHQITCSAALAAFLFASPSAGAPGHIVPPEEFRQEAREAVRNRDAQAAALQGLFESKQARKALHRAGLDAREVTAAIPALDDETLERLAQRALKADRDVAAGALNNQQLTYIVIALATAVLILVIVAA